MPYRKRKSTKKKKIHLATKYLLKDSPHLRQHADPASSSFIFKQPTSLHKRPSCRNCDQGGVKRILSPFNRFANNNIRIADKNKSLPIQSNFRHIGLSPKEKSYIICSCQTRTTRYVRLKTLASIAIKDNKIFSIYGNCSAVRKALLERGWVEKIPPNRMNLLKIRNGTFTDKTQIQGELERLFLSNLVEKYNPNLIWYVKDDQREPALIDMTLTKDCNTIINKLKTDAMWTTKQGLCSSMKRNYWFHIEDVAEVNAPRTYNSYDVSEIDEFVKDYKITTCTSLLKWILSMVANESPIFVNSGKISINVIVYALNRCKEYLFRKQHKDIDLSLYSSTSAQWNTFLKKYYRIIAKQDVFHEDKENKLPLYLGYAKFLLKEIYKYRPQLSCEGCHNIWIIKPAHCSRGRGIRMASKLAVITSMLNKANAKYVIQKYIEEPLLIYDTKFDIRQYYLVTSTYPLVIWMYKDCYLKFSSQRYNLKNYHESIHLTNNAVQRRYKNCSGRHEELPQNNMWHLDTFIEYLDKIGKTKVWNNVIYPGMKKSIIGIMLSCQDSLNISKNRFELYGCDFILDKQYKPWLIEINSCPDLNHTTPVTSKICPAVISDTIKVVIDHSFDSNSSTGRFECAYRQPITTPRYGVAADLSVRGYGLPIDYFHKGNIQIQESYDNPAISEERDIKEALNKLKQSFYNADIVLHLEDKLNISSQADEIETGPSYNTESENELSLIDIDKTKQVAKVSERTSLVKELNGNLVTTAKDNHATARIMSAIDIKTITDNYCSLLKSKDKTVIKVFSFSELDDGPLGKGSYCEIKKNIYELR